jgi:CspA family cold shock protein
MPIGKVKWFNAEMGFGFISPEDGSGDAFVHISAVQASGLEGLKEGDRVTYELEADRRSGRMQTVRLAVAK